MKDVKGRIQFTYYVVRLFVRLRIDICICLCIDLVMYSFAYMYFFCLLNCCHVHYGFFFIVQLSAC